MKIFKKIVLGTHTHVPAPVWNEPHQAPAKNLYGCSSRWRQLINLTPYDKVDAFNAVLQVFETWSQDIRSEGLAMKALWESPTLQTLEENSKQLLQQRIDEIQGRFKTYQGNTPPPSMSWGEGNWAPLPDDLQKQLKAQEQALEDARKGKR